MIRKDKRLQQAHEHLLAASALLAEWLTDNTNEAFEECYEIDDVKTAAEEAAESLAVFMAQSAL